MFRAEMLIGGRPASNQELPETPVHTPFDGQLLGSVPDGRWDEMDAAIEAATEAFVEFRFSARSERQKLLVRIADLVDERAEPLAQLMAAEVGKPISLARGEVVRLALTFRLAAELMDRSGREEIDLEFDPRGKDYRCFVERVPVGPVLAIVPYNWPYNLAAHKVAPALAAGCTVVLKPSPLAALSTLSLAALIHDAGCPSGVVNALCCDDASVERAVKDPRIALVSFTGSERVGWHIKGLVPEKPVVLELGGDASILVFDDADLEHAAARTALSGFGYAGQVCIAAQHVRVQAGVYEEFRELMVAATEATVSGDPLEEATVCGPLISSDAADRVMSWIDEAEKAGANVLAGGNRIGNVVEPTLLEDVPGGCKLTSEEVFGPILSLSKFTDLEEAFAKANASRFGIHCGVFSSSEEIAERAYRQLDVGGVVINDFPTLRFDNMPYGGVKRSGVGREGVRYAYEEMSVPKVMIKRR